MKECTQKKYVWKDIVGTEKSEKRYALSFPISGKIDVVDCTEYYQLDDFYKEAAKQLGVDSSEILTYTMDGIDFDPRTLPWGIQSCGCYIDGVPEWCIEQ